MDSSKSKCVSWRSGEPEPSFGAIEKMDTLFSSWRCFRDGEDRGQVKRAIVNPVSGEVIGATEGLRHEDIMYSFFRKDMPLSEFLKTADEHIAVESNTHRFVPVGGTVRTAAVLLYNQTKGGRERNARLVEGLRRLLEAKAVSENDIVCMGSYVEHSEGKDACGKVGTILEAFEDCSLEGGFVNRCPFDTGKLLQKLQYFEMKKSLELLRRKE